MNRGDSMTDIDYSKIREFDGSQHNGFEEMICQLANLEQFEDSDYFVSKDGSGGDGGIECYWKFKDGTEYGWQAKYFLNSLGSNEWSQIDKSVKTALEKHPNLTKYYVCVPKNRTDSRKLHQGKPTISEFDKWNTHVESWEKIAEVKSMQVEFVFWGKFEITQRLLSLKPNYQGLLGYWFDSTLLTFDSLKQLFERSEKSLGERYSTENNVALPIEDIFHTIAMDKTWQKQTQVSISRFDDNCENLRSLETNKYMYWAKEKVTSIRSKAESILVQLVRFNYDKTIIFENDKEIKNDISELIYQTSELEESFIGAKEARASDNDSSVNDTLNSLQNNVLKILNFFKDYFEVLDSSIFKSGKEKTLLVTGEAGAGKSHLLCDIAKKRLSSNLPTIFLLGQHYDGQDPIQFIGSSLGIVNHSSSDILSLINSLGETYDSRVLIIIDALNEGHYRERWSDFLVDFIEQSSKYKNIGIVLSCRGNYLDFIFPTELEKRIPKINHEGFKGNLSEAARKYLELNGIQAPNIPFLSPEFTNPLFLKIVCQSMKTLEIKEFPKGSMSFNTIFEYYLQTLEGKIFKQLKGFSKLSIRNSLDDFSNKLYPDNIWGIKTMDAMEIFDKYDNGKGEFTIFDLLISEGILSLDYEADTTGRKSEIVRFTYERFSDYYTANKILQKYPTLEELSDAFNPDKEIGLILDKEYKYRGIIEALSVEIPERYHIEFFALVVYDEKKYLDEDRLLNIYFSKSILMRSPSSITEETLVFLNKIRCNGYHSVALNTLLQLSTEPNHPWNSKFLSNNLQKKSLPERDEFWSTFVGVNDYSEDQETPESPLRTLLNWSLKTNLNHVEPERLYLLAITLIWFTTTSNRLIRQQATKALSKVQFLIKERIPEFISEFSETDDPYLVSSLYAAIYGAVTQITDDSLLQDIIKTIPCESIIEGEHPNILIRDHILGIFEYTKSRGVGFANYDQFMLPLKSKATWPLEIPSQDELDSITSDYSRISSSVQGFIGDFGKYSMSDVKNWSVTEISGNDHPKTCKEFTLGFLETLENEARELFQEYMDLVTDEEKSVQIDQNLFFSKILEGGQSIIDLCDDIPDTFDDNFDGEYEARVRKQEVEKKVQEEKKQLLIDRIKLMIADDKMEQFEWILHLGMSDRTAKFDETQAQRWVVKRAYDLGWTKERFDSFENIYCKGYPTTINKNLERIGKKYQWIAYYELLAILSDHYQYIDRGYSDVDDSRYFGAWQLDLREFDPTTWFKAKKDDENTSINDDFFWWSCKQYDNFPRFDLEEQTKWLWDTTTSPDLSNCFTYTNPADSTEWISMFEFQMWRKKPVTNKDDYYESETWYRVNSSIIKEEDYHQLKSTLIGKETLQSPDIVHIRTNGNQKYLGEFPWHSSYSDYNDWTTHDQYSILNGLSSLVPIFEYSWSTDGQEHMRSESTNFYIPSKILVENLKLQRDQSFPSEWYKDNHLIFFDPSFRHGDKSKALIRKDIVCAWLAENNNVLIWLIGGEKQLYNPRIQGFPGRLIHNGVFCMDSTGKIEGEIWYEEERP